MSDPILPHTLYALVWASFAVGHSWLCNPGVKAAYAKRFGGGYRVFYNVVAAAHLIAVALVGHILLGDGVDGFDVPAWLRFMQWTMLGGALVLFYAGSRQYDMGQFLGTVAESKATPEPLRTGGIHRYLRHPFYAGAYLLLWGLVSDPFSLATAVWASLYFIVGTAIEERRLVRLYGDAYETYRRQTPSLLTQLWRMGAHTARH